MKVVRARRIAALTTAVIVAAVLAACGSSSNPQSSSSSTAAASAGGAGAAGTTAGRAKLAACLKQHGVTLPSRPAGGRPPGAGTGSGTGTTPGAGTRRRGFFGGGYGAGGGRFSNSKLRAAFQACGAAAGFRGRAAGAGGPFRPTHAAITKFAACVKQHGYTLPKANLSRKGSIYPTTVERNKTFQKAATACSTLLRPAGGGGPAPGGGSSATATTSGA